MMHSFYSCNYCAIELLFAAVPRLKLFKKVVSLVVNKYESREVLDGNFPYCFHSEFGILNTFDACYAALR